jgi:AraC family transcriptional regulator, transcriptional activator of pobA
MSENAYLQLPDVFVHDFVTLTCCIASSFHRHPFYELVWVGDGEATYCCDFATYAVTANTLVFVGPGQVHTWYADFGQLHLTAIGFKLDHLTHFGKAHQVIQQLPFQQPSQPPLHHFNDDEALVFDRLFSAIHERFATDGAKHEDVLRAYLNLILVELERVGLTTPPPTPPASAEHITYRFHQLVEEHFQQVKQVQDYAAILGVTLNHLVETVRKSTGKTPKQIIQQRLALEAKRLLVHTTDSVSEISHQLDFNTPTYFSAWFKNQAGLTPVQFRQQSA